VRQAKETAERVRAYLRDTPVPSDTKEEAIR
jgi:hypothetical protein